MARARGEVKQATGAKGEVPIIEPPGPPLPLDAIIGQQRATGLLRHAIESGRIHHAWVFHGPAGVGKFTTALAFAALLLAPGKGGEAEAGRAEALLKTGAHPDLHVIRKELAAVSSFSEIRKLKQTTISKKVVDEFLLDPSARASVMSTGSLCTKAFIVDEADLLDRVTQDSMLKTLEEPPPGSVMILVTSDEHALLPTVRSRCQRVAFSPLSDADMERWWKGAGLQATSGEKPWLLSFASGSPGQALAAAKQGLFAWHTALEPMLAALERPAGGATAALGSTMVRLVADRAEAAVEGKPTASKDAANRRWAFAMIAFVAERARRGLGRAGGDAGKGRLRQIDLCAQAERQIDANVRYDLALENLGAQMATPTV